ncbi:MAG: PEP-CTERM sorting domain-containing protein [Cyanothece sp. SIO2G6]|nr:PEP-CTERM sorting domain-containing protein [Cyanothece sp. SIO2G6]
MKSALIKSAIAVMATLTGLTVEGGQVAWAGTLYEGWNYSIDSFNDGTEGRRIGENSAFEFYGLATKTTRDKVYFAVNSNLSLDGHRSRRALNGSISYGDLFLNFANLDSVQAANGDLHAIRFNETNDTTYESGLYANVTGIGLMTQNSGYSNLVRHRNAVNSFGGEASFGDLDAETAYFNHDNGQATSLNNTAYGYTNIGSGDRQGNVVMADNLGEMGLDFGHFGATGDYTFGFSVDRDLLPDGDFIAHLFAECDNDGVALAGTTDVPEPSTALGLAVLGLLGAGFRRFQASQDADA